MSDKNLEDVRATADTVMELEGELEASGNASVEGQALETAKATLRTWVDSVTGVVVTPALGRVTLIHANGRKSSISSSDLPFVMSTPVGPKAAD